MLPAKEHGGRAVLALWAFRGQVGMQGNKKGMRVVEKWLGKHPHFR